MNGRKKIYISIFLIWVVLWALFISRNLFFKGHLNDYKILFSRSLEGKRSYVTGDDLYEFLVFCNKTLPPDTTYEWIAGELPGDVSIHERRITYYLYPHLREKKNADFILACGMPFKEIYGYALFVRLDDSRHILKKKR